MNRRRVVKYLLSFSVLSLFSRGAIAKSPAPVKKDKKDKKAKAPKNLLGENEPLAKGMQYKHNADKVKGPRTNKKAFCNNCDRWNKCSAADKACKPDKNAMADYAPCNLFPNKVVANKGWCLSWQAIGKK